MSNRSGSFENASRLMINVINVRIQRGDLDAFCQNHISATRRTLGYGGGFKNHV